MNNYFLCLYQGVKSASCCGSVCIPALWAPWTTPNMDFNIQLLEMKACQMLSDKTGPALPLLEASGFEMKGPSSLLALPWLRKLHKHRWAHSQNGFMLSLWDVKSEGPSASPPSLQLFGQCDGAVKDLCFKSAMWSNGDLIHAGPWNPWEKGKAGTSQKMQTLSSSRD